jgi:hypothetical protein
MILCAFPFPCRAESGVPLSERLWRQLVTDAVSLNLPTKFLEAVPPAFIQFEFDDLRTYAAEYHPAEHRLVLNRTLSFNAAGGVLRPLRQLTHKELELLYHELFHAYIDFLSSEYERTQAMGASGSSLLAFAHVQQRCRYGEVAITPVQQRKTDAETRYLSESESWEALNETWAVFVGWAIWNQLEVEGKGKGKGSSHRDTGPAAQWVNRFEQAVVKREFTGYYVPEDADERRVAQKRFLAPQSQISGTETEWLMAEVLGFPEQFIAKLKSRPLLASFFKPVSSCDDFARR